MSIINVQLSARVAIPADTNGAQHIVTVGTNFPVAALAFDGGSTDEHAYWAFRAAFYLSGDLTIDVDWYAATAITGVVRWGAQIAVITPDTDSQNIETKAFATATEVNDTHLGTVIKRLHRAQIVLTNLDSLVAEDEVALHLYREASDTGNDTMSGDALVTRVNVQYAGS